MGWQGMAPHVEVTGTALAALDVTSVRDGALYFVTTTGGGYTAGQTWQVGGAAGARTLTLRAVVGDAIVVSADRWEQLFYNGEAVTHNGDGLYYLVET